MIRLRHYVHCEHPGCGEKVAGPPIAPSHGTDTTLTRGKAQEAGWQVRRGQRGADLCPYHSGEE